MDKKYYKLEIYIPESHFEDLRKALISVDAGHIGNYDCCLSYSRVIGTWRPLAGTDPYIGRENEISEEADGWRDEMWAMIRQRPDVRFFILTKRVPRIQECLPSDWGDGYENVELHITCENQRAFDERWPIFREIPAKHKGMNLAPMLGPIDITPALSSGQIEFVGLGGEGFGGRRPCRYEWVKKVSVDCRKYRVNLAFNTTGAVFVMNGRTYHLDGQLLQGQQAYKSGLSCFFGQPEYRLYDPRRIYEYQ